MNQPSNGPIPHFLQWCAATDRGRIRPNNEDSFLGLQFDSKEVHYLGRHGEASTETTDLAFAVSDGMGGATAGEFASRIAVDRVTHFLQRSFKQSAIGIETYFADVFTTLFEQIHRSLMSVGQSYEECSGMGATLSICWFTRDRMYFGHIGDSRVYYSPAQERCIKQISHDDTHVGWLQRNGAISERQARHHPGRNALQKALGASNQFVDPQVGAVVYESGDIFVLCTDGLVDGLYDEQILEIIRSPEPVAPDQSVARRLVRASLESAGRDNTTALVIKVL
ncbi:MAG: serine/threonine-protein phosphatase [Verrucomicrobia bacterium]|nr:serine/threonine-protein phosphatase [Verrucomicrobiota bacterium]